MVLTEEMKRIFDLVENTNECLFITGKAGTGKTTFLRFIVENTKKNLAVAAPTGIAAYNCEGVTLHSLFAMPIGLLLPDEPVSGRYMRDKIELFKHLQTLVIDEVSMVRADMMDYIDRALRLYRMNQAPFGGLQIVMIGDLYQLPPVVTNEEEDVLGKYYWGPYFFHALVWKKKCFRVLELHKVFRQHDDRFVEILNRVREYDATWTDIQDLDSRKHWGKAHDYDAPRMHLCAFRLEAEAINKKMLGTPTHIFKAEYDGLFNSKSVPCDETLNLRIGARVVILANDSEKLYFNGSMGTVETISHEAIGVRLDTGNLVSVEPHEWSEIDYKIDKDGKVTKNVKGTCIQFPLSLGWAITIHKSQGLTFDNVCIHATKTFAPGQLYVALSRCTTLNGIVTDHCITFNHIIPDARLKAFFKAVEQRGGYFDKFAVHNLKHYESIVYN